MLSRQEEMAERKDYLENEKRLRNQGTTFSEFAQSDAATSLGRFGAVSSPRVIGEKSPAAQYPAGSNWTVDPVPPELPLGVDINEMPVCGEPHELKASIASLEPPAQATGPTSATLSPFGGAVGPPSSGDQTTEDASRLSTSRVGSPVPSRTYRRF